ncbi:MAG: hypothetical protein ACREOZ_01395, partial [Gloeomargaritales cyanobacterium]
HPSFSSFANHHPLPLRPRVFFYTCNDLVKVPFRPELWWINRNKDADLFLEEQILVASFHQDDVVETLTAFNGENLSFAESDRQQTRRTATIHHRNSQRSHLLVRYTFLLIRSTKSHLLLKHCDGIHVPLFIILSKSCASHYTIPYFTVVLDSLKVALFGGVAKIIIRKCTEKDLETGCLTKPHDSCFSLNLICKMVNSFIIFLIS